MLLHRAERTDGLLISAAEQLLHLIVDRADVLLELLGGLHQLWSHIIMRLKVFLTVRGHTAQTGLAGSQFSPRAEITGHIFRSSIAVVSRSSLESSLLQLLH
ncbi:unnamed protein product [Menidia menidia]|uniref:(Atlantic silverside) hypothetical protein n=1 Tax=Menidia menidia TaxID=238744 RepID=A0A8S4BSG9_9TELE|nr:unnamed protein product [Menidia menidia]